MTSLTAAAAEPGNSTPVARPGANRGRLPAAIRELLLVAGLFLAYKLGRQVISGRVGEATANAASVWRLERLLQLPSELSVQHALLHHDWLVVAANSYYAYVHFPATAAVLIWLYLRRPRLYLSTRRILAWLTATALVVHVLFPLAPPRLVPDTGLLDTGALYGPGVYGPPDTDTLTNQYAAMPSLHLGWALTVAVAMVVAGRGRWRRLWLSHPLITLLVVVSTGNHYWLDAIVAVAMVAATAALVLRFRRTVPNQRRRDNGPVVSPVVRSCHPVGRVRVGRRTANGRCPRPGSRARSR